MFLTLICKDGRVGVLAVLRKDIAHEIMILSLKNNVHISVLFPPVQDKSPGRDLDEDKKPDEDRKSSEVEEEAPIRRHPVGVPKFGLPGMGGGLPGKGNVQTESQFRPIFRFTQNLLEKEIEFYGIINFLSTCIVFKWHIIM